MSDIIPYENTDKLTIKQRMWLKSYLNCFNMTQAARDAGYKGDREETLGIIGHENYKKLKNIINQWVDENLLSDEFIKKKYMMALTLKKLNFSRT